MRIVTKNWFFLAASGYDNSGNCVYHQMANGALAEMSHTIQMNADEVSRILKRDGWEYDRTNGSHKQYKHPEKPNVVTVAGHGSKPLPGGTLRSIFVTAGLEGVFQQLKQGTPFKQIEKQLMRLG
jgi:predicted RNA binding protein YcfA (HicA-like mRNA interferase family)